MAIVIIADDLSGAAELAGIAFARGFTAEVQRQYDPATSAEVIAVDTDSRGLPEREAAAKVEAITRAVMASRPAWIFKKTDSVLRGHPAVEIAAVLAATGMSRAVFVPANPSRGRTIQGGVYSIHGTPLDETALASDPEFPRRSARVSELLGPAESISVPDAATLADVHAIARGLDAAALPAGAADFFAAVLAQRAGQRELAAASDLRQFLQPPFLLVCGSQVAWPQRRSALAAANVPAIGLAELQTSEPHSPGRSLAIGIGDNVPTGVAPRVLLARFIEVAAGILHRGRFATVLAEGGATAAALAERMGWTKMSVVAPAPAGIGVFKPLGVSGAPLLVIKPGSYDWPVEIWRQQVTADRPQAYPTREPGQAGEGG